jgi:hypothetical protein
MLEYIALDLPQLPVDPIYPNGIAVNSPPELRPYFIHSYLQEKVFHFAARHASINQWLRVTYLRHQEHMQERNQPYGYPLNEAHYTQRVEIEAICSSLCQSTAEVLTLIYDMDYLKKNNAYSGPVPIQYLYPLLEALEGIATALSPHAAFIATIQKVQENLRQPFLHTHREEVFTGPEPVVFLPQRPDPVNPSVQHLSLSELVNQYGQFFQSAKAILQECSHESLTHLIPWN